MRTAIGILAFLGLVSGALPGVQTQDTRPAIRVGTYDNRAIAVAYAASRFNPVAEKTKEFEKAKCGGNAPRVAELEEWGARHQRRLHRQAFARVPVDDLLMPVRDGLAEIAREQGLDIIVWSCDYTSSRVAVVDVTAELVALFEPSPRTLAIVAELRERAPLDLDEVEAEHDH